MLAPGLARIGKTSEEAADAAENGGGCPQREFCYDLPARERLKWIENGTDRLS